MAALLAFLVAIIAAPVVLLLDFVTGGLVVRALYYLDVPFPIALSWVPLTIAYIIGVYLSARWMAGRLVRTGRALALEGNQPRWMDDLDWLDQLLRHDHGRWPVPLATLLAVVSLLALPAVRFHLLSPVTWTLLALGVPTILGIYRDRVQLQEHAAPLLPLKPAAPPPELSLSPAEIVAALRQARAYRGQLRATAIRAAQPAVDVSGATQAPWAHELQPGRLLHSVLASLGIGSARNLYGHQVDALRWLLEESGERHVRRHVVLSTGPGSGRRTTTFLVALERTLRRGAHVLVVTPDDAVLDRERRRFLEMAELTDWQYALHEGVLTADWTGNLPDPPPEILFCSLDTLHSVLLRDQRRWAEFFDGLELVVVHDIDQYVGILGANATQMFSRLRLVARSYGQALQFIATARPAQNLRTFAAELLSLAPPENLVRVVDVDDSQRPEHLLAVWMPPLDRVAGPLAGVQLTRRVVRQPLFATAVELGAMLAGLPHLRLLVYGAGWSDTDARGLDAGITRQLGTQPPVERLRIVTHELELGGAQQQYDVLLVLGAIAQRGELERLTGQLGRARQGGVAIVLAEHSPAALSMIRHFHDDGREAALSLPSAGIAPLLSLYGQHPAVVAKHLACALAETAPTRGDISELFGDEGRRLLDGWIAEGRARLSGPAVDARDADDPRARVRIVADDEEPHVACPLRTIGLRTEALDVRTIGGGLALLVDRERAVAELFPHRALVRAGQQLVLTPARNDAGYLATDPTSDYVASAIPQYELVARRVGRGERALPPARRIGDGRPFGIHRASLEITQTLLATRQVRLQHGRQSIVEAPVDVPSASTYVADVLVLTAAPHATDVMSPAVAHSLAHLLNTTLRATLPERLVDAELHVAAIPAIEGLAQGPSVMMFDTVPDGAGVAELLDDVADVLLMEAYRILVACPCQLGCVACLHDATCRMHSASLTCQEQLDKRATLLYLGEVLGARARDIAECSPAALDKLRYEGVTSVDDLLRIRDGVFRYGLYPVLDLGVEGEYEPAPVRFMRHDEQEADGLLGFFRRSDDGRSEVAIRPGVEEVLVGVMAHEYAHDWQFRFDQAGEQHMHPSMTDAAHVPYAGRLLVEGFAQWLELRVVDGYGFRESADDIVFRVFDEYGEGYLIIKSIEDELGVAGVLSEMHAPLDRERLGKLIGRTGAESRVLDVVRRISEGDVQLPPTDVTLDPPGVSASATGAESGTSEAPPNDDVRGGYSSEGADEAQHTGARTTQTPNDEHDIEPADDDLTAQPPS